MPGALRRSAELLLTALCLCAPVAGLEGDCVLGSVGGPVELPCLRPDLDSPGNFSVEWKRDDKVIFRSTWDDEGNVETWSRNHASIPTDAALTGDFSLQLPAARPELDRSQYGMVMTSRGNRSVQMCVLCLRIAARFRTPSLHRRESGGGFVFQCSSSGGFPQPVVHWLLGGTPAAQNASVQTRIHADPDSHLYNVTSDLTLNTAEATEVSCVVENQSLKENATQTYGGSGDGVRRTSHAMWIFSTSLSVVVAIMVMAGVAYQIHLDRISKRRKEEFQESLRGYKRRYRYKGEVEVMMLDPKESDV